MTSVFSSSKHLTKLLRRLVQQQQCEVHRCTSIDRCVGLRIQPRARTQSPRLSTARLQLAFGGRPSEQEEQHTQRASFVAYVSYESIHTAAAVCRSSWWARMLGWKKYQVERLHSSLRGQTRVSQRRLGCLSPGPSEAHSARLQTDQ